MILPSCRSARSALCIVFVVAVLIHQHADAQLFGKKEKPPQVATPEQSAAAASLFAEGEASERQGNPTRALATYREIANRYPGTASTPRALFRMAKIQETDKPQDAFKTYQKLIDNYPQSPDFTAAIEAQYKIASLFLDGRRVRLLGLPTLPSMAKAQEMFEQVLKNAPFTQWAPLAQFGLGQALEKQGKQQEAIAAYQLVVDKYPSSDVADDALYQIGYVYQSVSKGGEYDQSATEKAQDAFQDFAIRYPESEKIAQATENLSSLETKQTQSSLSIGKFYEKRRNPRAAAVYYRLAIDEAPDSAEGQEAARRLAELEKKVGREMIEIPDAPSPDLPAIASRPKTPAKTNVKARPDYVGPPAPRVAVQGAAPRPQPRTSLDDVQPSEIPEPPLPQ